MEPLHFAVAMQLLVVVVGDVVPLALLGPTEIPWIGLRSLAQEKRESLDLLRFRSRLSLSLPALELPEPSCHRFAKRLAEVCRM